MQIKYNEEDCSYTLTTDNRVVVRLSDSEMRQIEDYRRRNGWKSELEELIDNESDCYDFSEITREAFVEKCLTEIEYRWICGYDIGTNEIHDITIDLAKDWKVWAEKSGKDNTPDSRVITVGNIIANPQFDVYCSVKIVEDEIVLWEGYGPKGCPAEWLDRPVVCMAVRDNVIVIEI